MSADTLQQIQTLQFTDRAAAEALTLTFIRSAFPLDAVAVELRPLAVSLNSFNGFLTLADGTRLFFKTHTETDTVIGEYYQAAMLAEAGYPILQPIHSSTQAGQQLLIYEVIDDPSVFDCAWQIETGADTATLPALTTAQHAADEELLTIYRRTLSMQPAEQAARAPVHQLFYHRLTAGRRTRFYGVTGDEVTIALPDGTHTLAAVRRARWTINGQHYTETIDQISERAIALLKPDQPGPAIDGHGDAHNGNVFFRGHDQPPRLLYFDPAFAGRHHPLLDLTKPLFHNVFAMWMYHPAVKAAALAITLTRDGDDWTVQHDYALPPVRLMFFRSKVERVLIPTLRDLRERGWLRPDWREYLKAALFCCPFLTMNLADPAKFPPAISLLGLCMAVEMGSESGGVRSLIDRTLDEAAAALG